MRVVHEPCLNNSPLLDESLSDRGVQWMNVVFLDSLLDPFELRFGARASSFSDRAFVFWPETFAGAPRLARSYVVKRHSCNDEDRNDNRDNQILRHIE